MYQWFSFNFGFSFVIWTPITRGAVGIMIYENINALVFSMNEPIP
jgi:hypothetical protein